MNPRGFGGLAAWRAVFRASKKTGHSSLCASGTVGKEVKCCSDMAEIVHDFKILLNYYKPDLTVESLID
jgi:hypothetical protein